MPRMPNDEGPGAGPPEETPSGPGGHAADRLREFEAARGLEESEVVPIEEPVPVVVDRHGDLIVEGAPVPRRGGLLVRP